ncbi:G-type lectin S-receptor-like serine/threonine-protein kinase At2g19130 [Morus notabilis]|uniref:G-type lectin S-receptor-like serine/threonine-protein kinase At2g19130 n=1 Tax=Morus notabilis TaxID=981085 RepID=UPI000CED1353|nr:G-type lectin S-receptor-like serine/threonine-protein kinase At2g19130 [Morus notabilis]
MDYKKDKPISFMLVFVLIQCLFLKNHLSIGAGDTISVNHSLSGDQNIISASGIFVLGLFTPGNSSNYYLGMWYKEVAQTIVWVANREKPVMDRFSSEVRISNGNLVLFNESKLLIWSTNVNSSSSHSTVAVLLDNGNLVLKDESNLSKPILWESFDYLTDTWLPGSKLGYNKEHHHKNFITSWKNLEDPSPGLFSFELVPSENSSVIMWNKSRIHWSGGAWVESYKSFSLIPEMKLSSYYNFTFVSNDKEIYLTYSIIPDKKKNIYALNNTNGISRFVMDVSGQIKEMILMPNNVWDLYWTQPREKCKAEAFCGAYGSCNEKSTPSCNCLNGFEPKSRRDWDLKDYSGGCIRKTKLQCGNNASADGERDRFADIPSMLLPENKQSKYVENIEACESICFNNCSCTAYSYDNTGCSIWSGDLLDLQQLEAGDGKGRSIYIRLAASEFQSTKHGKGPITGVVVGSVVASIVVVLVLISFLVLRRKKMDWRGKGMEGSLMAFGFRDLQNATKNFSEKLGGGGFGSVFKGILPDSTMIAVKKLEGVGQGEKQFRAEVSTIGTIQHVNLVRLRGFCSQGAKKLLVYDFMSNGSLASHLFHQNTSKVLDWKTRYQIALGTARGLVYLHEECRDCIIHCDIKPENVLLDADFCPIVADFGLAKLVGREFSRVLTTMRGTRGYLAPEWIAGVAITSKADVYSFGMMLFELVSGRRNSEQTEVDGKLKYFPSMAISAIVEGGDVLNLLDRRLEGNVDLEEVEKVCKVACWCIQDNEAHRPSMSQVVQMLEGNMDVYLPPVPQCVRIFHDNEENTPWD